MNETLQLAKAPRKIAYASLEEDIFSQSIEFSIYAYNELLAELSSIHKIF